MDIVMPTIMWIVYSWALLAVCAALYELLCINELSRIIKKQIGGHMIWSNQLPTTAMSWTDVMSEIYELIDEVKHLNFAGIVEELCDIHTCLMCAIDMATGVPMPIFWMKTYYKWVKRVYFFRSYLNKAGLEFKIEYLRYGSNYLKAHKRRKVFELARDDQLGRIT